MKSNSMLQQLKAYDHAREGMSGEHWLTLGLGVAAWLLTRNHRSFVVRTAGMIAGTALVGRAASGRDGPARVLQYLPVGRRIGAGH